MHHLRRSTALRTIWDNKVEGGGGDGTAKHNKHDDVWVLVNEEVLDVTKFLPADY